MFISLAMIRPIEIVLSLALLAAAGGVLFASFPTQAQSLAQQLSGKILLQVEAHGEAWYVYPDNNERYYLGRPSDAFELMRNLGLGISNANLELIPESSSSSRGNTSLRSQLSGKILLQVEANGEAWYVYPENQKRYYLGRPDDAFRIMRELGLGISDENLLGIPVAKASVIPDTQLNSPTSSRTVDTIGDTFSPTRILLVDKINGERSRQQLPELSLVKELSLAAQTHADDMTARQYFDFTSPEGKTIDDFAKEQGYLWQGTLSVNHVQTNRPESGVIDVIIQNGGSGYQNIIDADLDDVGIGVGQYQGVPIYVIVFASSLEKFFDEETSILQDINAVRTEMLARVNAERDAAGKAPLTMNGLLNQSAQGHTNDMLERSYYAHETPEGLSSNDRIKATGYHPSFTGENIAKGQFSVEEVMDAWMNSPDHRANILSSNFTEVGFGLSYGKNQNGFEIIWAQNFGQPL